MHISPEIDVDEVVIVYKTNDGIYKSFGCILAEDCEPHCEPLHDDETQVITYVSIIGNTVENEVLQPITRLKSLKVNIFAICFCSLSPHCFFLLL